MCIIGGSSLDFEKHHNIHVLAQDEGCGQCWMYRIEKFFEMLLLC